MSAAGVRAPWAAPRAALPDQPGLALRGIAGNLTRTDKRVTAWYRLAAQPWSFRGDAEREHLMQLIACQLGALQGRHLQLRVTSRPYPVRQWAEAAHHNAVDRPATPAGALGWPQFLQGEQRHLAAGGLAEKEVILGVDLDVTAGSGVARLFGSRRPELQSLQWSVAELHDLLGGPGLAATPASPGELVWLVMRSLGMGLPAPAVPALPFDTHLDQYDLARLAGQVALCAEPGDPTLTVLGHGPDGMQRRRNLVVLTVGQMDLLQIPEVDDPWMQRTDRLPFPVEWSARLHIRRPEDVTGELRRQMGKVRSQMGHYLNDHGEEPPTSLSRAADQVLAIEDQLSMGLTQMHTRASGWWRIAVTGAEAETMSRVQQVLDLYRPKIAIEQPRGQFRLAREFVPGEPMGARGHRRRGPVTWVAAAMPAASASIGDDRGVLLGETCTATRRPVTWDPWRAQEVQQSSGLTAIVGGLGSGKSFLTGLIVYKTLMSGARWTVLDPSGPLARLAELPELAPFSRHINLLRAAPGILNPYRVVAEPRIELFTDTAAATAEQQWRDERRAAAATRRQLVLQVLGGLLPYDIARLPETRIQLQRAVKQVGGAPDRHPGQVIDKLREHAAEGEQHAGVIADFLEERRDLPQAALLFPAAAAAAVDPWKSDDDLRLTVLTMQGLSLPRPGSAKEEWTDNESLGVELLNLASWLTQRTIYDADRNQRKGVALDETHFLSQVPTGKVLIDRLARDSRKFNVRALFASQLAGDLLRVSGFASLVNAVFVGRTDDAEAQEEALRLLRVPTGVGYEPVLGTLSPHHGGGPRIGDEPRQFVFADGGGGVEAIRIDLQAPHLAHLRAALDTNPSAAAAVPRTSPPAAVIARPVELELPTWPGQRAPQLLRERP